MSKAGMRYIYLIEAEGAGAVKVGIADNPHGRLKDLQTGCPFKLTLRHYWQLCASEADRWEKELHKSMEKYRVRGEWFRVDAPQIAFILSSGPRMVGE
jgi:hypothetical protein